MSDLFGIYSQLARGLTFENQSYQKQGKKHLVVHPGMAGAPLQTVKIF